MPDQYQEIDNIFPEYKNGKYCRIEHFADKLKDLGEGCVVEFGVASAQTTIEMASKNPDRKIYAIDHFEGLEQTSKPTEPYMGWHEGAFALGDPKFPHIPKTLDEVYERLAPYKNVELIVEDIHKLKSPQELNIPRLAAVHIDVDIYEPTVSALNWVEQAEWDRIYIRFDDWHGHDPQFDHHERLAAREWLDRTGYNFDIPENGKSGLMIVWR